jgi:hypothetical protein
VTSPTNDMSTDNCTVAIISAVAGVMAAIVPYIEEIRDPDRPYLYEEYPITDPLAGPTWVDDCLRDPARLYVVSRLRASVFEDLSAWLRSNNLVKDGRSVTADEKLLTFLYICAHGVVLRAAGERCGRSISTISRGFHEVLDGLVVLYKDVVAPTPLSTPDAIVQNPFWASYFQDCVGALDGTHLPLFVRADEQRRYRNRKGWLSHNVLAVVDFNLNFMYLLPGWEGSAHDGRVLRDARLKGFSCPPGKYFVADAGYTNEADILTPYRGVRYHLQELREQRESNRLPANAEELFNYRHSSLRNAVERVFGVFKRRWRLFKLQREFDVHTHAKLVFALAGIHNLINKASGLQDIEDVEAQPMPESDFEEVDEETEEENQRGSGSQYVVMSGEQMAFERDEIARRMWVDQEAYKALFVSRRES